MVQWIASTARATGTVEHLFKQYTTSAPKVLLHRFKDKPVTPATPASLTQKTQNGKRTQKKRGNVTQPLTCEISYKTLGELGKVIAKAQSVEVPYNVLLVLKGIIQARKGFAT